MKQKVIIELSYSDSLHKNASLNMGAETVGLNDSQIKIPGVTLDAAFGSVQLSGQTNNSPANSIFDTSSIGFDDTPTASTYLVRGEMDDSNYDKALKANNVVAIYSDPTIESFAVCPEGPIGNDTDVERLLCVERMRAKNMDGTGVLVAIVDTGINLAHLVARGKTPIFDAANSWVPVAGQVAGSMPVGHGTMCAYDVLIAAPKCTLLDVALLSTNATGPTIMSGILSDAIRAYRHLIDVKRNTGRSLVVNNSWGMFHSSWDFPVGHTGNYSHNPNHPFNRIVGELERAGADILFAAGNCGSDCPDVRCTRNGVREVDKIYGANSHPAVLSVAGVTKDKIRIGYSTKGPGCLTINKPDISGYTHFRGSGVQSADGGTSAACPVVAGVVAAVRSVRGHNPANPATSPAAIRSLVTSTAEDVSPTGYDLETGFGIVNGCGLVNRLFPIVFPPPQIDLCRRYPWICRPQPFPPFPPRIPFPPFPPIPPINPPVPPLQQDWGSEGGQYGDDEWAYMMALSAYYGNFQQQYPQIQEQSKKCNCGEH
jgi:subtilisin family serine protease